MRSLRILLDVNVLVTNVLSRAAGRTGTVSQKLVSAVASGQLGETSVQLVLSIGMIAKFGKVLLRHGAAPAKVQEAHDALVDVVRRGPEGLDPFLLLGAGEAGIALLDREDAAARADLLVTDNLTDFAVKGSSAAPTSRVRHVDGRSRRLECRSIKTPSGHRVIVAHPIDVLQRSLRGQPLDFRDLHLP